MIEKDKVLDTKWLQVYRETVQSPGGHTINDYYVATKSNGVLVMAFTKQKEIVMLREYEHGCHDYLWRLPGGGIDGNESAAQAARRELVEETGYKADKVSLFGTWFNHPGLMPDKTIAFIAHDVIHLSDCKAEIGEDIEVHAISQEDVFTMALRNEIKSPLSCSIILSAIMQSHNSK